MKILNGLTSKTPQSFQLDAGVWLKGVDYSSFESEKTIESLKTAIENAITGNKSLGATTGGGTFEIVPDLKDLMDDVDGAKGKYKNCMLVTKVDCKMTTTLIEVNPDNFAMAIGVADKETFGTTGQKITIRYDIKDSDYNDLTWVGSINKDEGMLIVRFRNAMNTKGLSFTMENQGKGKYGLEVEPFIDLENPDKSPVEIFII